MLGQHPLMMQQRTSLQPLEIASTNDLSFGDVDADGDLDIVGVWVLLRNNGTGRFVSVDPAISGISDAGMTLRGVTGTVPLWLR